jgi:lipopolysaccharide export system permease protein
MILRRHLMRLVGGRVLAALAVLVAILQILDLLDVTTEILQRKLGAGGVIHYALLRTPTLVEQTAPLAMLAGCLFAFAQLARENAVVALRAAGVSAYQVLAAMAPAAVGLLALHLACTQWLSPHSEQALDAWWTRSAPKAAASAKPDTPTTRSFRVGQDIVVATEADPSGRRLSRVSIYRRDAEGRLAQRLRADQAVYGAGGWRLIAPSFEVLGPKLIEQGRTAELAWRPGPRPADVRAIFSSAEAIAPGSAQRALAGGASVRPPAFYSTALQRSWSTPAAALVMLLLAGPVLLINFRGGGAGTIVACLAAGLAFLVTDGVFTALGEGGDIPSLLAAWAAPAIFAALGASALMFAEG